MNNLAIWGEMRHFVTGIVGMRQPKEGGVEGGGGGQKTSKQKIKTVYIPFTISSIKNTLKTIKLVYKSISIPFYSRLRALYSPIWPDISNPLVQ